MDDTPAYGGGCTWRGVRYRMTGRPLFVRWCQRETGTAFALNAMIESNRVQLPDPAALPCGANTRARAYPAPEPFAPRAERAHWVKIMK